MSSSDLKALLERPCAILIWSAFLKEHTLLQFPSLTLSSGTKWRVATVKRIGRELEEKAEETAVISLIDLTVGPLVNASVSLMENSARQNLSRLVLTRQNIQRIVLLGSEASLESERI